MRKAILLLAVTSVLTFTSCGGSSGDEPATAEGFSDIEKDLKGEFGGSMEYDSRQMATNFRSNT